MVVFTREKILYGKYYETPEIFHRAIADFFSSINQKYKDQIKKRFTLKFQFFNKQTLQFYPV